LAARRRAGIEGLAAYHAPALVLARRHSLAPGARHAPQHRTACGGALAGLAGIDAGAARHRAGIKGLTAERTISLSISPSNCAPRNSVAG
jgi:hypothetical protein